MPFSWPDFSIINGPLSLKYGRHQNFLSSVKIQNVLPYFKKSTTTSQEIHSYERQKKKKLNKKQKKEREQN